MSTHDTIRTDVLQRLERWTQPENDCEFSADARAAMGLILYGDRPKLAPEHRADLAMLLAVLPHNDLAHYMPALRAALAALGEE